MRDEQDHSANRGVVTIVLVLLLAAAELPASAAGIYTWIDANNVTNFSQRPPADGARAERLGDAFPVQVAAVVAVEPPRAPGRRAAVRLITPEMRRLGIRLADTPAEQRARELRAVW